MMENPFVTFDRFTQKEPAIALSKLLTDNGIENVLEDHSNPLDTPMTGTAQKEFRLKLHKEDFPKAEAVIEQAVLGEMDQIPTDYYLLGFSDDELVEVIAHKDEWSPFDFMLARKLLRERGKELSDDALKNLREQRLEELSRPEKHQKGAIIAGYVFAVLGGLIGMFIGWYLSTHKRTLPNGEMVYAHSKEDRKSGKTILRLSVFFFVFWIALRFVIRYADS